MGPSGVYMGWGWAGWVLRKDMDSMLNLQFLSISQLNNKPDVCLWCSLLFFPQLFHLDQMVSLCLYFPLSWSLAHHTMSSRLPITEARPPLPGYIGSCSVLGMCAAASLPGHIPPETPHLPFSWRRLQLFLPKARWWLYFWNLQFERIPRFLIWELVHYPMDFLWKISRQMSSAVSFGVVCSL